MENEDTIGICITGYSGQCKEKLDEYLSKAKIIAWDSDDYYIKRQEFITANCGLFEGPIGPIIPSYMTHEPGPPCGFTEDFIALLYDLQHLRYSDKVLKDTGKRYKAIRSYHCEDNRRALAETEKKKGNVFYDALYNWAIKQYPVDAPVRVLKVEKFTPPMTKRGLRFYLTDSGLFGSHTPFIEDRSKYDWVDVFGTKDNGRGDQNGN